MNAQCNSCGFFAPEEIFLIAYHSHAVRVCPQCGSDDLVYILEGKTQEQVPVNREALNETR